MAHGIQLREIEELHFGRPTRWPVTRMSMVVQYVPRELQPVHLHHTQK